jgi:hypothetical protein
MQLPPHIIGWLDQLRRTRGVPETLFERFEALKTLDPDLSIDERCYRWETALAELRRYLRSWLMTDHPEDNAGTESANDSGSGKF